MADKKVTPKAPGEGSPEASKAAATDTDSSGLEVAKAATVAPTTPAGTLAQRARPTSPRTKSSPPAPARTNPMPSAR